MTQHAANTRAKADDARDTVPDTGASKPPAADESGGPSGPEPTRYGDWERAGRCIDF